MASGCGGTNYREHWRCGGTNGDCWYTASKNMASCTTLCQDIMLTVGVGCSVAPNAGGHDPYYAKCYDAVAPTPLNSIRVQYASQVGSADVDPELPQTTPITNVSACLRMHSYSL